MISIQDVGKQILTGNPGKFYVMVGSEYGIKSRYIQTLKDHYGDQIESESVADVLNMMKTKRMIPLKPALYVIRYDENFLSSLDDHTQEYIQSIKIAGTVVCIYEQSKQANKLDKYLPDLTVSVDAVNPQFLSKYLHSDFPKLPDRFINIAVNSAANYNQAKNMCRSMQNVSTEELYKLSDNEIASLFGCVDATTEHEIKIGIASRNFAHLSNLIDNYEGDVDILFYAILSTMLELEKLMCNKFNQSDIKEYVNRWTKADVYYMFMNTYNEIKKIRSSSILDMKSNLIYLISLLQFKQIPSPEAMI